MRRIQLLVAMTCLSACKGGDDKSTRSKAPTAPGTPTTALETAAGVSPDTTQAVAGGGETTAPPLVTDPVTGATISAKKYDGDGLAVLSVGAAGGLLAGPASDAALSGASVNIAAGTLAIGSDASVDVFFERAQALSAQGVAQDLGLANADKIKDASAGLLILPALNVAVNGTLAIALPLDAGAGLALTEPSLPENPAILYRIVRFTDGVPSYESGVLPPSAFTVENGQIKFAAPGFGAYALVALPAAITAAKTAPSAVAALTNAKGERAIAEAGLEGGFVSLRPYELVARAGYDLYRGFYVNAANQASLPLRGRCTDIGGAVTLSGMVDVTEVPCVNYTWGRDFTVDASALPEGNLDLTMSYTDGTGKTTVATQRLVKDTVAPVVTALTPEGQPFASVQGRLTVTAPDFNDFKFIDFSTPAAVTVTSDIEHQGDAQNDRFLAAAPNGTYELIYRVWDAAGNTASKSLSLTWAHSDAVHLDLAAPAFSAVQDAGNAKVNILFAEGVPGRWASNSNLLGTVIVRRLGSAVAWAPANGQSYTAGPIDATQTIVAVGKTGFFYDTDVQLGKRYYYKAFEMNLAKEYSAPHAEDVLLTTAANNQIGFYSGLALDTSVDAGTHRLYVAADGRGFAVYDIAGGNAAHPVLLGTYDGPEQIKKIVADGNYAYAAAAGASDMANNGMIVFDVANPAAIMRKARLMPSGEFSVTQLLKSGNTVWAVGAKLHGVDVTTPTAPAELVYDAGFETVLDLADVNGMVLDGSTLYVSHTDNGSLKVFDVANRLRPAALGTPFTLYGIVGDYMKMRQIVFKAVGGTKYVYASFDAAPGWHGVARLDVTDPSNITGGQATRYRPYHDIGAFGNALNSTSHVLALASDGNTLYFSLGKDGFFTADITGGIVPVQPAGGNYLSGPFKYESLAVAGNYVYTADAARGFEVLDKHDLTNVAVAASVPAIASAEDLAIVGTKLYVADSTGKRIHVLSIADPAHPTHLGLKDVDGYAYAVAATGTTVYAGTSVDTNINVGVVKLNAADPTSIAELAHNDAQTYIRHLAFGPNGSVGVAGGANDNPAQGVYVLDSGLSASRVYDGGADNASDVAFSGAKLVTVDASALSVRDLDSGAHGSLTLPVHRVAVSGNKAYAVGKNNVGSNGKLYIVDITDAAAPVLLKTLQFADTGGAVVVSGTRAYVCTSGTPGVYVIDVADAAAPVTKGILTVNSCNGLRVAGGKVYVADGAFGVTVHADLP
jgi:hypothetical protein